MRLAAAARLGMGWAELVRLVVVLAMCFMPAAAVLPVPIVRREEEEVVQGSRRMEQQPPIMSEPSLRCEEEAMEAINDSYGEELAQASTYDSLHEEDLIGYLYEDLEPYLLEEVK